MATWHQQRNTAGLAALYRPEPGRWKCITDRPGEHAGCITFASREEATAYARRTGALIIPPPEPGL